MPKITVAIPVYNVEKYLRQCLDSVVNQTLKDLQIICVDDGSTDGSLAIVQEYAERDKRIEVYSKPNEGLGITRNFVYPLIKGKYTYFMDSDDWLELDGLEHVYQLAEKYNADVVCLNYYKNDRVRSFPFQNQTCWVSPDKKKRMWALQFAFPFAWAKLYNTDFLTKNQIFFQKRFGLKITLYIGKPFYWETPFAFALCRSIIIAL
ncbi:MAG: glycosyltransferase family 2 protein [Thermoguttaceae bacterium]|nr:glycosyltransferase family 2 protein [Thermoguttaceae bacterium]